MTFVIETDRCIITPTFARLSSRMMRIRFLDKETGMGKLPVFAFPIYENQVFSARDISGAECGYYRCVIRGGTLECVICIACTFIDVEEISSCVIALCESRTPITLHYVRRIQWEFRLCDLSLDDFNRVRTPSRSRLPSNPDAGHMLSYLSILIKFHQDLSDEGIDAYISSEKINEFVKENGGEKDVLIGYKDTSMILSGWIELIRTTRSVVPIDTPMDMLINGRQIICRLTDENE